MARSHITAASRGIGQSHGVPGRPLAAFGRNNSITLTRAAGINDLGQFYEAHCTSIPCPTLNAFATTRS